MEEGFGLQIKLKIIAPSVSFQQMTRQILAISVEFSVKNQGYLATKLGVHWEKQ